jgi:hypothetical protein
MGSSPVKKAGRRAGPADRGGGLDEADPVTKRREPEAGVAGSPGIRPEQAIARRPDGTFPPGVSGNPNGRSPDLIEVRDLARQHTKFAIDRLVKVAKTSKKDQAVVMACIALLDRGWGKPAQTVAVTKKGILNMIFASPRGYDPLAGPRELPHEPIVPPMSPEAAALAADMVTDFPPMPRRRQGP